MCMITTSERFFWACCGWVGASALGKEAGETAFSKLVLLLAQSPQE